MPGLIGDRWICLFASASICHRIYTVYLKKNEGKKDK